jgi:hypothetical protein
MSDDRARRADWEIWAHLIVVEVWEAVALSFGAEPETIPGLSSDRGDWRNGDPFAGCRADFLRRLKIVCNHIESGALQAGGGRKTELRKLKLVDFSEWALSLGWELPPRFPRQVSASGTRARISDPTLKRWYKDIYLPQCIASGSQPSEEADMAAAQTQFGTTVRRQQVRDARDEFAPVKWKKQGRRKRPNNSAK